jgi:hypothetical protein
MSAAAEPLAWTRNFDSRGALNERSQYPPHLQAVAGSTERAISKMAADDAPGLDDFSAPDLNGRRRPGPEFWRDFAKAIKAVQEHDGARIDGKAHTPEQWAELAATPALGTSRHRKLARIALYLLEHDLPHEFVLVELLIHNRATCCPPLQPHEVEPIHRWALDRDDERRER